jgi:hypothetical protein
MYTPRYGMHYVTQQTSEARLNAIRQHREAIMGRSRGAAPPSIHDEESGALWRMLTTVAVVFVVVLGGVVAMWAAGLA